MSVLTVPLRPTLGSSYTVEFTVIERDGTRRNLVANSDLLTCVVKDGRGMTVLSLQTDSGIVNTPEGDVKISFTPSQLSTSNFDPENDTYSYLVEIKDGTTNEEWPLLKGPVIPQQA